MNSVSPDLARARELLSVEPAPGAKARVLANVLAGPSRQRRSPRGALIVAFALLGASTAAALGTPEIARWFAAPARSGGTAPLSRTPDHARATTARHVPPPAAAASDAASIEPPSSLPLEPSSGQSAAPGALPSPETEHRSAAVTPSAAPSAASTLAQEVAAYEEAAALVTTQPGLAIVRLRAHRERFPASALGEEVSLRLVQAFTALGRVADARREAAAFVTRYPRSPKRAAMQTLADEGIGRAE